MASMAERAHTTESRRAYLQGRMDPDWLLVSLSHALSSVWSMNGMTISQKLIYAKLRYAAYVCVCVIVLPAHSELELQKA